MGNTMMVLDRAELERLAQFAASLFIGCNKCARDAGPTSDWEPVIAACERLVADFIREDVMRGDLKAAAETLVAPDSRCCCGIRFVAQVEQYLDPRTCANYRSYGVNQKQTLPS